MRFNPLVQFDKRMVQGFLKHGDRYLVTQTYERGRNPLNEQKLPLLLSHYSSLTAARNHYRILKEDKWAAIIDLENPFHFNKLSAMGMTTSAYLMYVCFARDGEMSAKTDRYLAEAVRRYMVQETDWRPLGGETVHFNVEIKYGELFLQLKYRGEILKEGLPVFEDLLSKGGCSTTFPSKTELEPYQVTFQNSLSMLR